MSPDIKQSPGKRDATREQLLKKQRDYARVRSGLQTGELVDDALARSTAAAGKWFVRNSGLLQWSVILAAAGGIGYAVYSYRAGKNAEAASGTLVQAIADEGGRISEKGESAAPSTPSKDDDDPTPVFASAEERQMAALNAYQTAAAKAPGSGPALLSRLGEAGVLLDKRDWDGALAAFREVKASKLAAADADVRGRTLEGIGYALEGKGDRDGALAAFRELENTDVKGLKELGMYHQARLLLAKGETEKAKGLLRTAHERLQAENAPPSGEGTLGSPPSHRFSFLQSQIDDILRRVDPSALVSATPPDVGDVAGSKGPALGAGGSDQLMKQLQQKLREAQQKASNAKEAVPVPPPVAPAPPTGSAP